MNGFKQLINYKNRINFNTFLLIDHILVNTHDIITQSGVINSSTSDHNIICCTRKILKAKYNKRKK